MSSTNKTTNYELSQFVGSDKPTWLGDYNSDMGKIDTQMKANATAVTTAQSTATAAGETARNSKCHIKYCSCKFARSTNNSDHGS